MSKDRDWVDYANLASNVAQTVQLSGIKNQLSGVAQIAAAQAQEARWARQAMEQAEQKAEQKAERIAKCREVVVQGEKHLKGLNNYLSTNPRAVLALALGFKNSYEQNSLSSASFDTFDEKDRVMRLFTGLDDVVEQSSSRLTPEQQNEARQCLHYQLEDDDLQRLIRIQKDREERVWKLRLHAKAAQAKLDIMHSQVANLEQELRTEQQKNEAAVNTQSSKIKSSERMFFLVLSVLGITGIIGMGIAIVVEKDSDNPNNLSMEAAQNWFVFIAIFTLFCGFVWWLRRPSTTGRESELGNQINALYGEIFSLEPQIQTTHYQPDDDAKALYQRFGGGIDTPSAEYETMLQKRRAFVSEVLSDGTPGAPSKGPLEVFTPRPAENAPPNKNASLSLAEIPPGMEWATPSANQHITSLENQKVKDAVLALVALGYNQDEAHRAVRAAHAVLGPSAGIEDLVRACLRNPA